MFPARAIDQYTSLRVKMVDGGEEVTIDKRLEQIVDKMFQRCFDDSRYKQVIIDNQSELFI